jgi:integrase
LIECPCGPFFTTETGVPINSAIMGKSLQARREKLGIDYFTTHDLRRTAATRMVELVGFFDIVALAIGQEAGGRDTRTLTRHYVRTDMLERKTAVLEVWDRRLGEIISGEPVGSKVAPLRSSDRNAA